MPRKHALSPLVCSPGGCAGALWLRQPRPGRRQRAFRRAADSRVRRRAVVFEDPARRHRHSRESQLRRLLRDVSGSRRRDRGADEDEQGRAQDQAAQGPGGFRQFGASALLVRKRVRPRQDGRIQSSSTARSRGASRSPPERTAIATRTRKTSRRIGPSRRPTCWAIICFRRKGAAALPDTKI